MTKPKEEATTADEEVTTAQAEQLQPEQTPTEEVATVPQRPIRMQKRRVLTPHSG